MKARRISPNARPPRFNRNHAVLRSNEPDFVHNFRKGGWFLSTQNDKVLMSTIEQPAVLSISDIAWSFVMLRVLGQQELDLAVCLRREQPYRQAVGQRGSNRYPFQKRKSFPRTWKNLSPNLFSKFRSAPAPCSRCGQRHFHSGKSRAGT